MTNKELLLPFFKINEIKMPFVVCKYNNKDGNVSKGLFLIDSGSKDNILIQKAADTFCELEYTDTINEIGGLGDGTTVCKIANAKISLKGHEFNVPFSISSNVNLDMIFGPGVVLGILGSTFLREHELTIDFKNKCLRTSNGVNSIAMNKDTFLFPMTRGLKTYGIPLIYFTKGDKVFYCVPDSGANMSLISHNGVCGIEDINIKEEKNQVCGLISENSIKQTAVATFSLISINENDKEHYKLVKAIDEFNMLPSDYILNPGGELLPISALIGTEFMLENEWILDYKHGYIYSSAA